MNAADTAACSERECLLLDHFGQGRATRTSGSYSGRQKMMIRKGLAVLVLTFAFALAAAQGVGAGGAGGGSGGPSAVGGAGGGNNPAAGGTMTAAGPGGGIDNDDPFKRHKKIDAQFYEEVDARDQSGQ
jgi:hypothetical protein